MPPARGRNVDDSRSETSSTITNQKEKSTLGPASGSGVSKAKRFASGLNVPGAGNKAPVYGNGAAPPSATPAVTEGDKDPSLPRVCRSTSSGIGSSQGGTKSMTNNAISLQKTEWATMSVPILRSYRTAHRLHVPAAFNYPHAEVTYKSCELALRAPSAVYYRRKQREQHLQRRKHRQSQQTNGTCKNNKPKDRDKEKGKSKETSNTHKASCISPSIAQVVEPPDPLPSNQGQGQHAPSSPSSSTTSIYLGPREPASNLANVVRKHFNAQQLSEADTIARFIYVVQQNGRQVWTEGSEGDGSGYWMGSQGRAVRRIDGPGGDVGFRLRFRP
ncbi:uncharacterized protein Z519_12488 [Cladophialophora bantiana CBS 173.52]|uniref:Histone deacetylase complex subunit SAP30 Sin3 binding domain-containing protein n=1 Tax=Cladophialophora bantiana (strain ATCC 10958 / CBS 173.52 / CDC B-1940 / NIH 8579) TaxID=1442370 RepID=A0A0D2FJJ2_CLAB1|nr:uncharacterized protein Z519_12488 [Cladophialophora bantiana CBS 173.52]KIW86867.1 hypothetical protein Z519_12488 [Cladophialophora bantiana CBS 173.52]